MDKIIKELRIVNFRCRDSSFNCLSMTHFNFPAATHGSGHNEWSTPWEGSQWLIHHMGVVAMNDPPHGSGRSEWSTPSEWLWWVIHRWEWLAEAGLWCNCDRPFNPFTLKLLQFMIYCRKWNRSFAVHVLWIECRYKKFTSVSVKLMSTFFYW